MITVNDRKQTNMSSSYQLKREWTPNMLVSQYFAQGDFWINSDGDMIRIEGMAVPYAMNALLYLERVRGDIEIFLGNKVFTTESLQDTRLYKALRTRSLMGEGADYIAKDGQTRSARKERVARGSTRLMAQSDVVLVDGIVMKNRHGRG